ncbi:MAG: glutamate---cysteine ligase / carboxylate-amine ligase [Pseudonocardiales bacterium]|nr:glutamate---cysteine ligase / carboxylate-amine ligase [Pseudonocardiales bacterium]
MDIRSVGVEEELLLVDTSQHRLAAVADEVIARAWLADPGSESPVEHEFKQEQIEIGSTAGTSMPALHAELVHLRGVAAQAAEAEGSTVVALATSPWKSSPSLTAGPRYERMTREFGLLARQQLTCGQHVHVGIESRAEGVGVLDQMRGWLPVLTAMSVNSPFWQGQDTGYQSFRSVLWGRWPTAGPTEVFGDEASYDAAVAELLESGTVVDDGMIYFDARLSARYPTVEIRVADVCTDVRDAVLLAALVRALVETMAGRWRAGEPVPSIRTSLLRVAAWRAARSGLSGELVDPRTGKPVGSWQLVNELIEQLGPALRRCGDDQLVADGLARLRAQGTGADRQRSSFALRSSLRDVVADAATRTLDG